MQKAYQILIENVQKAYQIPIENVQNTHQIQIENVQKLYYGTKNLLTTAWKNYTPYHRTDKYRRQSKNCLKK